MNKLKNYIKELTLEPAMLVVFVFLMLLFSRLVVSRLSNETNEYLVLIILQLLTFGIPAAIWNRLRDLPRFREGKRRFVTRLRFSPPRLSHIVIIASATAALMSGCLLFSIGLSGRSSLEGSFSLYDTFVSRYNGTPLGVLWLVLAYAALPAFCEELVFRGILAAEYDKHGVICSITMTTLWFGFLHFNFQKLTVYLFAGLVLAALLYATRSVFSVMIAHFLYNLFGLFGQQYITEFYITAGSVDVAVVILITILLLSGAIFCGAARRLYLGYAKRDEPSDYREPSSRDELLPRFRAVLLTPFAGLATAIFLAFAIVMIFI